MKINRLLPFFLLYCFTVYSQENHSEIAITKLKSQKDSTIRATLIADSLKIEKRFAEKMKWVKFESLAEYPVFNMGFMSGIIPVKNPTEIPDPNMVYKLLFELTLNNPDSLAGEYNSSLVEVARVINLHVASGIPQKNIIPVIVVHAAALNSITGQQYYNAHYKMNNPNLPLIEKLEAFGTKIIACGQAMTFFNIAREDLLPSIKISLTAQTVLTAYQTKGFVLNSITR